MKNKIITILILTMISSIMAFGQSADDIVGLLYSQADSKNRVSVVQIYKENNKYYAYSFAYQNSTDTVNDVNNPKQELKIKATIDGAGLFGKTLTWKKVPSNEVSKYTPLNKSELRKLN